MTSLVGATGRPVLLTRELGRGGEGSIYATDCVPGLVAKLYHREVGEAKAAKLLAMTALAAPELREVAAWPVETLHETPGGPLRGFLMPQIEQYKDIHLLYGPKTRLHDFPHASYRFLVQVARNLAAAFAAVHALGHVIGDVNPGGVHVSSSGAVTLVDCDSFQVAAPGRVFTCDVGTSLYQPPELQWAETFRGLHRTPAHDCFGLAVLVFQTLFLARHPFAGVFSGQGEMTIERAIRELRFVYHPNAARIQMERPQGSLGLHAVPFGLARLFSRALLDRGAGRPAAAEWVRLLEAFSAELRDCDRGAGHAYLAELSGCPLCEIERAEGVLLFLPPEQPTASVPPPAAVEGLWLELVPSVMALEVPSGHELAGSEPAEPLPAAALAWVRELKRERWLSLLSLSAAVVGALLVDELALGLLIAPLLLRFSRRGPPYLAAELEQAGEAANRRLEEAAARIAEERASSPALPLARQLGEAYRAVARMPLERAERASAFEGSRSAGQLRRYLDRFELGVARIEQLGASMVATLLSHGVQTADDLSHERLAGVAGLSRGARAALLSWRESLVAAFRFDPDDPVDAREQSRIQRELDVEHARRVVRFIHLAEQFKAAGPLLLPRLAALASEQASAWRERDRAERLLALLRKAPRW